MNEREPHVTDAKVGTRSDKIPEDCLDPPV
jgi:hypothetical protein